MYGDTCIPEGKFEVVLSYSNRFKKIMPLLLNVPGFDGIRMHGGLTKEQTLGCILCGMNRGIDSISNCAPAIEKIMTLLKQPGKHSITIAQAENNP